MGIHGLLQFIKEASEPIHVRKYKGQAVAVDTYCWLHKGAIACAEKLAKGEPTDRYVGFCMKFVNMLLSHGIKPILVFDGCTLPSKKEVERSRRERRQANLLKGKQLLREGKVPEARECFTRSINITHAMAHKVIKAARSQGVDCLVAPYEADAQLAYLNKAGIVQAIITEDSDLLAFGCKKVILKMDQFGNGLEIDQARLGMCRQLGDVFTEEKFRYMCILSGCDYLSSLRGIGLAKACKVLKLANNPDIVKVIKKIGHYLKMNITVPEDYIKGFIRANNTFLYQLVFDPIKRKLIPLNAYEDDVDPETLSYAGQYVDDSIALQIALGNKDINTFEQIDDYNPDTVMPAHSRSHSWDDKTCQKSVNVRSIWHKNYCPRPESGVVSEATRLKQNPSTVGVERVISTNGLNLPRKSSVMKRPRSEELSEDDLLSQYSLSFTKKTKKNSREGDKSLSSSEVFVPDLVDGPANKKSLSTPPRTRNKFATFLQRKNEESGAVVVPGTRSRFFCSSPNSIDSVSNKVSCLPLDGTAVTVRENSLHESDYRDQEGEGQFDTNVTYNSSDDLPSDDIPSDHIPSDDIPDKATVLTDKESSSFQRSRFTRTISPPTLGTLRSCFSWTGGLGDFSGTPSPSLSTALQQFQRKSNSPTSLPENNMSDVPQLKSYESSDDESHPSREGACSSQSQQSGELSLQSSNTSKLSQSSSKDSDSEESDCNIKLFDSQGDQTSKLHLSHFSKKDTLLRNKVPGLYKSSSADSLSTTKIKPLGPARASGLSKKPASVQKRKHHNAENKPGLQIKLNELWKNFGFKKDSEKLPSSKKPLSPVRDNIQLTPEAEDDIFNKPECVRVQRAMFQ
ncbi:exonuclease 1 isoform X1 [Callithrix jacchus]|uniref:Exonuclease 1 n=2 Tax=Callithrix jacchus TaxID=9483 RepID=F7HLE3_CALJA|nr:exonuclease 1 [Callithrix jacchus]XP_035136647.2 exonuclease 1 [Callithrix jacchus]XP_035136649.2 exonuclease 1 [Callithrix jacchus]XP_054104008.1 exonuclease 1 [Callithrix jacchus]XP_054104009.1 exonuclease 1 [Callithrix jacchus]